MSKHHDGINKAPKTLAQVEAAIGHTLSQASEIKPDRPGAPAAPLAAPTVEQLVAKALPVVDPVTPAQPPAPVAAMTLEELVTKAIEQGIVPKESLPAYQAQLEAIRGAKAQSEKAKAMVVFDAKLKLELIPLVDKIAKECGADLSGRKIVITYPEGKFAYTNAAVSKSGSSDSGKREGFPGGWGAGKLVEGETTQNFDSPSKLAQTIGLRITGHVDMPDVFARPRKDTDNTELPKIYKFEGERGKGWTVTKTA